MHTPWTKANDWLKSKALGTCQHGTIVADGAWRHSSQQGNCQRPMEGITACSYGTMEAELIGGRLKLTAYGSRTLIAAT